MTTATAKFILHREGLDGFSIRELADLLNDRYIPLKADIKSAILTLRHPAVGAPCAWSGERSRTHA